MVAEPNDPSNAELAAQIANTNADLSNLAEVVTAIGTRTEKMDKVLNDYVTGSETRNAAIVKELLGAITGQSTAKNDALKVETDAKAEALKVETAAKAAALAIETDAKAAALAAETKNKTAVTEQVLAWGKAIFPYILAAAAAGWGAYQTVQLAEAPAAEPTPKAEAP